jgi:hypothetical protein
VRGAGGLHGEAWTARGLALGWVCLAARRVVLGGPQGGPIPPPGHPLHYPLISTTPHSNASALTSFPMPERLNNLSLKPS